MLLAGKAPELTVHAIMELHSSAYGGICPNSSIAPTWNGSEILRIRRTGPDLPHTDHFYSATRGLLGIIEYGEPLDLLVSQSEIGFGASTSEPCNDL